MNNIFYILRIIFGLAFLGGGLWHGVKAFQGYGLSDMYVLTIYHEVKNPWVRPNKATNISKMYLWAHVSVITFIGLLFLFI